MVRNNVFGILLFFSQRTCKLFYSAIGQNGWYAVAVQIEDFAQENDTEPLSSVPLQFLVNVFHSNDQCANNPEFVYPTPITGSCFGVPFNTTFFETLIAKSGSNSTRYSNPTENV